MSSIRYQDLLSVTMEDHVTIHAIDTLNLDRELTPQIHHNVKSDDFPGQVPPPNDVHFDVLKDNLDLPF